jgi:SAM-dependent methyltransferase
LLSYHSEMAPDDRLLVDFGRAADDYAKHRPGFPAEFYDHVRHAGVGLPGQRVLDLGTGTGTLARGFAERGCVAVGVDPSPAMLAEATKAATAEGLAVTWVCARAEATDLPDRDFDVVSAGQCWHWFGRSRAAAEAVRLLRPGGRLVIAYFTYLPLPGTVGAATEEIILRHNPTWPWAGLDGRHERYVADLLTAGLRHRSTLDLEVPVAFTHESWRGRIRACNGVLTLPPETVAAFDAELARVLSDRFPEPVISDHRLFVIIAEKPLTR